MTTKISPSLQPLIDHLIQKAIPYSLCASGMEDEARVFRMAVERPQIGKDDNITIWLSCLSGQRAEHKPVRAAAALAAKSRKLTRDGELGKAAVAAAQGLEVLGASTPATDGALVRLVLELHQERGGASAVGALVGKDKKSISRVATKPDAGLALDKEARGQLLAHLGDPIGHPLPAAAKPGPRASGSTGRSTPHLANTAQLRLTPSELARVRSRADGHKRGVHGWLAEAIDDYVGEPLTKVSAPPVAAVRCTWQTDADALVELDKAIGGKTRAPHLRAAVLKALGSGRAK